MNFSKWIGAALGWSFGGPIGAILGLALGSLIDALGNGKVVYESGQSTDYTSKSQTQPGDFEVSLLILASIVIKADRRQDQRELDFVRMQFVTMYGKERANNAFKLFKEISKQQDISTRDVCLQIRQMMQHASRLQLIHFLFGIAKADGTVNDNEMQQISVIAGYLGISQNDYESIKAMFYSSSDSAYKILEIDKSATNDEIKKAYRTMAKKYHPDKVLHLGKEHQKGAEEKFKQVQEAYDKLQKERGF